MNVQPRIDNRSRKHPCFDKQSEGVCGRVHLPVAPRCNIKCNYCDRRTDCVNESRPGVSSAVLSPAQACAYLSRVLALEPRITVAGIAGPGDPLANPEETLATLEGIRRTRPDLLFCLSTNGLALPALADRLAEAGVTHLTVTVNAVDPAVGEKIYAWVRDGKVIYRGRRAAEVLLERQRAGIRRAKELGLTVKVNVILIPGVNEDHVEEVAREMASLGVDVLNVMPMAPVAGTEFGGLSEPGPETMKAARDRAAAHLPQMRHCRRCRADAAGLLGEDRSAEFAGELAACAGMVPPEVAARPYVAVATREGLLVNRHLGEADSFQIWEKTAEGARLVETREAPARGGGVERWRDLARRLGDCRLLLVSGFGKVPEGVLAIEGLPVAEASGFIEMALKAAFEGGSLRPLRRSPGGCRRDGGGGGCGGDGGGCG